MTQADACVIVGEPIVIELKAPNVILKNDISRLTPIPLMALVNSGTNSSLRIEYSSETVTASGFLLLSLMLHSNFHYQKLREQKGV